MCISLHTCILYKIYTYLEEKNFNNFILHVAFNEIFV